jgi:hypothetical protein
MRRIKHKIPIYGGRLYIIIAKDFNKAKEKYKLNISGDLKGFYGMTCRYTNKQVVLLEPNASTETVAHEAVHLTNDLFSDISAKLSRKKDEPQAYLTGWFVKKMTKALKK